MNRRGYLRAALLLTLALARPVWADGPARDYVIFSINVQDFAHPALSAATLRKLVSIHERHRVPVDFYLTTTMADVCPPDLIAQIKTSRYVSVSYHVRPPAPYYLNYDWLGLRDMTAEQLRATILRYETHGLDLATGQTTPTHGGYGKLKELLGYAPVVVAPQSGMEAGRTVAAVFRELGARMFALHGRAINLGDQQDGVWLRPEHTDLKLFEHPGGDAGQLIAAAFAAAHRNPAARAPYFVGVKMHDNDFFATASAWVTTYVRGRRSPPWTLTNPAPLLSEPKSAALWSLYEAAVAHAARQRDQLTALNAPGVLALLGEKPEAVQLASGAAPAQTTAKAPWLYVAGTLHIETRRQSWPDPDALLAFCQRATKTGMRWSIGADIGWLEGEPRAGELIRATEALGVQWDVHAHALADRANCAAAIQRLGGHPTAVASGLLVRELDSLRAPIRGRNGATFQAQVVWGFAFQPGHGQGADDLAVGLWRPKSATEHAVHDPRGSLIAFGSAYNTLAWLEQFAREKPASVRDAKVVGASVMLVPRTLRIVNTDDGIEAIETWAARFGARPQVRWATIAETAQAWLAQGGLPSRIKL